MNTTIAQNRWEGGVSPFGQSWQKLMMWFFIVGDALLFAGFLASYGFTRLGAGANWPHTLGGVFSTGLITTMTFVLISSSATMACAVAAAKAGDKAAVVKWTLLTLVGGALFLGMQAFEWTHFIGGGGRPWGNPWGDRSFGAYFFLITGFHGTHSGSSSCCSPRWARRSPRPSIPTAWRSRASTGTSSTWSGSSSSAASTSSDHE